MKFPCAVGGRNVSGRAQDREAWRIENHPTPKRHFLTESNSMHMFLFPTCRTVLRSITVQDGCREAAELGGQRACVCVFVNGTSVCLYSHAVPLRIYLKFYFWFRFSPRTSFKCWFIWLDLEEDRWGREILKRRKQAHIKKIRFINNAFLLRHKGH